MNRRLRRILIAAPVVLVLAVGAAYAVFSLMGDDAPPPPSLAEADAATTTSTQADTTTQTAAADGALKPVAGDTTYVGYRVHEKFIGIGDKTAVGRTGDVTGTVTVEDDAITAADLSADLTTLQSDEDRRDNALRGRGIETDRFPKAQFVLDGDVPLSGEKEKATGKLTLHGVTKEITVTITGRQNADGTVDVAGTAPIQFADFDVDAPSVGGFVTVDEDGTLEFRLRLASA
jgi:polyisoprenoid-binding protein YceI